MAATRGTGPTLDVGERRLSAGQVPPEGSRSAPLADACAICGGRAGATHRVREMMFGRRDGFNYAQCSACGCLQQREEAALSAHYPEHYVAFEVQPRPHGPRGWLRKIRNRGVFGGNPLGRLLDRVKPYPVYGARDWFGRMGARRSSRILDVGCGSGELLRDLVEAGFTRAEGVDPFLPDDVVRRLGGLVRKAWLHDVNGEYDIVMFHHVLEHMPDQLDALRHAARLLRPGAWCLVRVPIVSDAWTRYRENWVQLDAPRHLFIHTEQSLVMVAARAGLRVDAVEHDSTWFQFAGSELYARGIPLTRLYESYTRADFRRFDREARRLNAQRRGDQAAFYFRKG